MDCLFCEIVAGEIPATKVYEDDHVLAFLDIRPVNPGHALVVPKKHSVDITEADDDDLARCIAVAKKIGAAILASGLGDAFNIGINTKPAAGQVIFHTHIHVMPRKADDGYRPWIGRGGYGEGEAEEVATQLRTHL